ncbi:MAG: phycobiliprotein lyase [Leptolyngbyaceae cyanobacterium]
MSIVNFFETVEGTWFSQRTTHFLPSHPSQTGQTTLKIAQMSASDVRVTGLCQQFDADANRVVLVLSVEQAGQSNTYGSGTATPERKTLLLWLKSDDEQAGTFISQTDQEAAVMGQYQLEAGSLNLSIRNDQFHSDERLWYVNPNLRMRTSLVKRTDGLQMASFCSELRRMA